MWFYGLHANNCGTCVKKPMTQCSGEEIMREFLYYCGLEDKIDEIKVEDYAAYYFKNTVLVDLDKDKLIDMEKRVTGTEYTDYIYYNNWRKGEASAST